MSRSAVSDSVRPAGNSTSLSTEISPPLPPFGLPVLTVTLLASSAVCRVSVSSSESCTLPDSRKVVPPAIRLALPIELGTPDTLLLSAM